MQKIQLSIPAPCHESWQLMSPTEQGRFCNACAKVVIDFSTMTDVQVLNYFSSLKNEKICGRVLPIQLDNPISRPIEPKKKLFWYWNYITLFFLFFSKSPVKAQTSVGKIKISTVPVKPPPVQIKMGIISRDTRLLPVDIAGKVTDKNGKGIPFAAIKEKGTQSGTTTDEYGVYKLKVNGLVSIVEISAAGYVTNEFSLAGLQLYNFMLTPKVIEQVITMAGTISYRRLDNNKCSLKNTALLSVKDTDNNMPINKATLIIKQYGVNKADTFYTDKNGSYQVKKMPNRSLVVNISAKGYESKELTVSKDEINSNEGVKEIRLNKIKIPVYRNLGEVVIISPAHRTVKGDISVSTIKITNDSVKKASPINTFFRKMADSSLFLVNANSAKVFPNPIQRGNSLHLTANLQRTGIYNIKVVDAGGRIVLQKQVNTGTKELAEKIEVDSKWGSGMYFIIVSDNNKQVTKSSFIVL